MGAGDRSPGKRRGRVLWGKWPGGVESSAGTVKGKRKKKKRGGRSGREAHHHLHGQRADWKILMGTTTRTPDHPVFGWAGAPEIGVSLYFQAWKSRQSPPFIYLLKLQKEPSSSHLQHRRPRLTFSGFGKNPAKYRWKGSPFTSPFSLFLLWIYLRRVVVFFCDLRYELGVKVRLLSEIHMHICKINKTVFILIFFSKNIFYHIIIHM